MKGGSIFKGALIWKLSVCTEKDLYHTKPIHLCWVLFSLDKCQIKWIKTAWHTFEWGKKNHYSPITGDLYFCFWSLLYVQEGWTLMCWHLWPPLSIYQERNWAGPCWCVWWLIWGGVTWRSAGGQHQKATFPCSHTLLTQTGNIVATALWPSSRWQRETGHLTGALRVTDGTKESPGGTGAAHRVGLTPTVTLLLHRSRSLDFADVNACWILFLGHEEQICSEDEAAQGTFE